MQTKCMHPLWLILPLFFILNGCGSGTKTTKPTAEIIYDTSPDQFSFVKQNNVALSAVITSDIITISGIDTPIAISIENGLYSINDNALTADAATIKNGDKLYLQHNSANEYNSEIVTTVTVGDFSADFTSITHPEPALVNLSTQKEVQLGSWIVSEAVQIESSAHANIINGEYSVNGGEFTNDKVLLQAGDIVSIRHLSALNNSAVTSSMLTVGSQTFVFNSITQEIEHISGEAGVEVSFPNSISGSSKNQLTVKGTVTASKSIQSVVINNIEAQITNSDNEERATWSATVSLNNSDTTKVVAAIETKAGTIHEQKIAEVNQNKLAKYFVDDLKNNRLIGRTVDNKLLDINIETGAVQLLRNFDNFHYNETAMVYRSASDSLVWIDNFFNGGIDIKEESLDGKFTTSRYYEAIETNGFSLNFANGPALSPDETVLYYVAQANNIELFATQIRSFNFETNEHAILFEYPNTQGHYGWTADITVSDTHVYVLQTDGIMQLHRETGKVEFNNSIRTNANFASIFYHDEKLIIDSYTYNNKVYVFDLATNTHTQISPSSNGIAITQPATTSYDYINNRLLKGARVYNGVVEINLNSAELSPFMRTGVGSGANLGFPNYVVSTDNETLYVLDGDPLGDHATILEVDRTTGNREVFATIDNEYNAYNSALTLEFLSASSELMLVTKDMIYRISLIDQTVTGFNFPSDLQGSLAATYVDLDNAVVLLDPSAEKIQKISLTDYGIEEVIALDSAITDANGAALSTQNNILYIGGNTRASLVSVALDTGKVSEMEACNTGFGLKDLSNGRLYNKPTYSEEHNKLVTGGFNTVNIYDLDENTCITQEVYDKQGFQGRDGFIIPIRAYYNGESLIGSLAQEVFLHDVASKNTVSVSGGLVGASTSTMPDSAPAYFSFATVEQATLSSSIESNEIVITGINTHTPISVIGGEYSINGSPFTASPGKVVNNDKVVVRTSASDKALTKIATRLKVGARTAVFDVITKQDSGTLEFFEFNTQNEVNLSVEVISNEVTVKGLDATSTLSVIGGEVSLNGGEFTDLPRNISNGDTIKLRHISVNSLNSERVTWLSIGNFTTSFASKTHH